MVRSQSIYPSTGYTTAPPFVPDPLAEVPFEVILPYIDTITGTQHFRNMQIGIHFDDNVWNSGGRCSDLENWLQNYWQYLENYWLTWSVHSGKATYEDVQTEVTKSHTLSNSVRATVSVLNSDPSRSYYWGTSKISKYGSYQWSSDGAFFGEVGFLNSALNEFFAPPGGGVNVLRVNVLGPNPLALVSLWKLSQIPDITFTGWLGITGFYNANGITYI